MDCDICEEPFSADSNRPRSLPCGHTLCTTCCISVVAQGQALCPTCRAPMGVTQATDLPVNYYVEQHLFGSTSGEAPQQRPLSLAQRRLKRLNRNLRQDSLAFRNNQPRGSGAVGKFFRQHRRNEQHDNNRRTDFLNAVTLFLGDVRNIRAIVSVIGDLTGLVELAGKFFSWTKYLLFRR